MTETFRAEHYEIVPGQYILMSVSDTGIGMDEEIRAKVFEPFFTTKGVGKGTGMGLATVYGIVKQNRGYIYVTSSPGKGTVFTVYLPVHEGEPERVRMKAALSPKSAAGGETVLVVEDDPALLDLICRALADHGYRILKAGNGERALEVSNNHQGFIDLILTDVIMPGVDVRDMVCLIHAARKDTKILYISGYTDSTIAPYGVLEEGLSFLGKPFTPYELLQKIRQVLVHGTPISGEECVYSD
ncbi:MAG: PAS/PAC sensor hybrid histidine kinase [uncultured bacterium]|nr:MAG: PAS/PAC sensor hybrid histidine kinase [uncultured bacterium]